MYKIICSEEKHLWDVSRAIEKEVNELTKQGWTVQGGVTISCEDDFYCMAQAMVKKDD